MEEGESAKTTNRRQFQNMLLYCREHKKKVDYVVVYWLSRFSRHTSDHHEIKALLSSFGVRLRSATEPIDDSSSGKFIESMIAAVSEFDNNVLNGRWPEGRQQPTRGAGHFPLRLAIAQLVLMAVRAWSLIRIAHPFIQSAFELFATGRYEQQQVLKKVTAKGLRTRRGKKVPLQSFNAMLRKPIYAGRICISSWGIDRRGEFVSIVSEDTFYRVQALLSARRIGTSYSKQHPDFPLRHLFVHALRSTVDC